MANDYRITKDAEGKETVTVLARIGIGEIADGNHPEIIPLRTYINSMKDLTTNRIARLLSKHRDSQVPLNELVELLDRYADLKLMSNMGVEHLPIIREADGKLSGFAAGMEEEKVED